MASTRRQCRERLVVLFDADAAFTTVYGHAPLDLRGTTKVLAVFNDRTRHDRLSKDLENNFYIFFIETFAIRSGGEDAEDALDDMHEAVRSIVNTNVSDSTWERIALEDESDSYFGSVAGVPYRIERHVLLCKVTQ